MLKSVHFDYQIFVFENRGRDVLPFIQVLESILKDDVDFILKIHTKKSKHRSDGDKWRNAIFDDLLSESEMIKSIISFHEDRSIGIISAEGQIVPMRYYWGSNEATVLKLSSQLGGENAERSESPPPPLSNRA
jgi:lipopolysaccharide biosynthesis protein